jgi:hypothetical protein
MKISSLNDQKKALQPFSNRIAGFGKYAYKRSDLSVFFEKPNLVYTYESEEDFILEKKLKLTKLEDFKKKEEKYALFYKFNREKQKLAKNLDLIPLNSSPNLFDKFDNKTYFREITKKRSILSPPCFNAVLDKEFLKKIGVLAWQKIVFQKPQGTSGGKGTFIFDANTSDLNYFVQKKQGKEFLVSKFIKGKVISINACCTKNGVFTDSPKLLMVDITDCFGSLGLKNSFCGNDWSFSKKIPEISSQYLQQACKKIGSEIFRNGFRGIFGIDAILEDKTDKVYVLEINPRILGSFPFSTFIEARENIPSILGLHLLEFLEAEWEASCDLGKRISTCRDGASLILFNDNHQRLVKKPLKPGTYVYKNKIGLTYKNTNLWIDKCLDNEIVLTEGITKRGQQKDPGNQFARIFFPVEISEGSDILNDYASYIVKYFREEWERNTNKI